MIRFQTLGGASLEQGDRPVTGGAAQRKALAVLAVIASSGTRGISRDRLLALLWSESPPDRARNALNQMLHAIRRGLGNERVVLGTAELRLNPEVIGTDIAEFDEALRGNDLERGIALFAGPFLDGFYLRDAPEFERWAEAERARLAERFARAIEDVARTATERGDNPGAATYWRRLAATDPLNSRYAVGLMEALVASGDPAGALQTAQTHTILVREELDAAPDSAVAALAESLRRRAVSHTHRAPPEPSSRRPLVNRDALTPDVPRPGRGADDEVDMISPVPVLAAEPRPTGHPLRTHAASVGTAFSPIQWLAVVGALAATLSRGHTLTTRPDVETHGPPRIAVLPFENLGDSSDAYFANGVTDAVREKLTALDGLEVIAPLSSETYRHTTKTLAQIGRELNARYLVVGAVRWAKRPGGASRVEVRPALVDTKSATDKWEQAFDAPLTDVFQVQAEIAEQVARQLQIVLTPAATRTLVQRPTTNLAAYDAYLKGRDLAHNAYLQARARPVILAYEHAVQLDSTFALAWAALGEAHALIGASATEAHPLIGASATANAAAALGAIDRALALDPLLPEAYEAEGMYDKRILNDEERALAAYQAGLKLVPGSARLLGLTGQTERNLGRWLDGLKHQEQAALLDPRDPTTATSLALTYVSLRRFPQAIAMADRGVVLEPSGHWNIEVCVGVDLARGDLAGARAVLRADSAIVDSSALAALLASDWRIGWAFDSAYDRLLRSLSPGAFTDRGDWALALAESYERRGDDGRARAYADSARTTLENRLQATPTDAFALADLGIALAYLGQRSEAVADGQRALALRRPTATEAALLQHRLVQIYLLLGERDQALDRLEALLYVPYILSPAWVRIDPTFASLHGNPRFERLIAQPTPGATPLKD